MKAFPLYLLLALLGLPAGVYAVVLRRPQGLQAVRVVRD
jgi:hypothetical protein